MAVGESRPLARRDLIGLLPLVLSAVLPRAAFAAGTAGAVPESYEPLYATPTRLDGVGRILVPVMINGRGPFRFIIDTGASHSALSPQLVATLGLPLVEGGDVALSGVTGSATVPTVRIELLEAGALRLVNRRLPVVAPSVLSRADGILGVEGLRNKRLDIDFRRDRVTISQSKGKPAPDGYYTVLAQQRFGGLLIVDARVGRINARAVIDTGAERSLGNPVLESRLQRRANAKALSPRDTEVFGATDAVQSGRSVVSPTITIGNAELSNLEVTFGDLHVFKVWDLESVPAVLLGMDLLGTADHLIIDYRRSELQIKAPRARG